MSPIFLYIGGEAVAPGAIPSIINYPTVSYPNNSQGVTMTTTDGVWTNTPTSFTFQWQRNFNNITGETSNTYVTDSGDIGGSISCLVTANNGFGNSLPAESNFLKITATGRPYRAARPQLLAPIPVIGEFYQIISDGAVSNIPPEFPFTTQFYVWTDDGQSLGFAEPNSTLLINTARFSSFIVGNTLWDNGIGLRLSSSNGMRLSTSGSIPVPTVHPVISGGTSVGDTLTLTGSASWSFSPVFTTHQWVRTLNSGLEPVDATSHIVTPRDRGQWIQISMSGFNNPGLTGAGGEAISNFIFIPL